MQVVIDIPDKDYQVTLTKIMLACYGCRITELPKGHGRLVDADALTPKIHGTKSIVAILDSPTIIEADKGVDE